MLDFLSLFVHVLFSLSLPKTPSALAHLRPIQRFGPRKSSGPSQILFAPWFRGATDPCPDWCLPRPLAPYAAIGFVATYRFAFIIGECTAVRGAAAHLGCRGPRSDAAVCLIGRAARGFTGNKVNVSVTSFHAQTGNVNSMDLTTHSSDEKGGTRHDHKHVCCKARLPCRCRVHGGHVHGRRGGHGRCSSPRRHDAQTWPSRPIRLIVPHSAGRRDRRDGAPGRPAARRGAGPVGHRREPARRVGTGRDRDRGRGGAGRLHASLMYVDTNTIFPSTVKQLAPRSGRELHADHGAGRAAPTCIVAHPSLPVRTCRS